MTTKDNQSQSEGSYNQFQSEVTYDSKRIPEPGVLVGRWYR